MFYGRTQKMFPQLNIEICGTSKSIAIKFNWKGSVS